MRRPRKNIETKKILFFFVLIIFFFVVTAYTFHKKDHFLWIEKVLKDGIMGVQRVLVLPFSLGNQPTELLQDTYITSLKEDIEKLKEQLHLQESYTDFRILHGKVISRDSSYWYHKITIDQGEKNRIMSGDILVNASGLVGKVTKTSYFTSEVSLLTDPKNRVSVSISFKNNKVFSGITRGYDEEKKCILIEGLSNLEDVKEGDIVYTNGMGGVYPKGIYVGKIERILQDGASFSGKAFCMKSDVSFETLGYVSVLGKVEEIF